MASPGTSLRRILSIHVLILAGLAAPGHGSAGAQVPEASDETLAELFADLSTGREFDRAGRTLRWERPITYVVMSRKPDAMALRAPRVLKEYGAVAGVAVEESRFVPWSDPSAIPENSYTTDDGFRGHIQRVQGKDVDEDPHFVVTWGTGENLRRAEANLILLVDDRETLVAQLAGGDSYVEARRRDLKEGRLDCLFFLHENRSFHIVSGLLLLNTSLGPSESKACINEEMFQVFGLINDVHGSHLTMLDQDRYSETATPTQYDMMLLRLLYHPQMETGLDRHWAKRRAMELLPELRKRSE